MTSPRNLNLKKMKSNKFRKGQRIICLVDNINPNAQDVKRFKIYKVRRVMNCPNCWEQAVSVGEPVPNRKIIDMSLIACECGNTHRNPRVGLLRRRPGWTTADYFCHLHEFSSRMEEEIKTALQREDYETAKLIKDKISELNPL